MNMPTNYTIYNEVTSKNISMLPSFAGIIPDRAKQDASQSKRYVCAFCDEMPQNVITRVVQLGINIIELCGNESPTYIKNLRLTLSTDIMPDLQIWKVVPADQYPLYEDCVDAFVINKNEANDYQGKMPFLIRETSTDTDDIGINQIYGGRCIGIIRKE